MENAPSSSTSARRFSPSECAALKPALEEARRILGKRLDYLRQEDEAAERAGRFADEFLRSAENGTPPPSPSETAEQGDKSYGYDPESIWQNQTCISNLTELLEKAGRGTEAEAIRQATKRQATEPAAERATLQDASAILNALRDECEATVSSPPAPDQATVNAGSTLPTAKPDQGKGTGGGKERKKRINARMLETIKNDTASMGWSSSQWAKHLRCAKSSVVETEAWKDLAMRRERRKAERACDRRRRPKGSDLNRD
jgi:hypothetical protein